MSKHTITLQELEDCLNAEAWHQVAASFGKGSSKTLEVDGCSVLRVKNHGQTVFLGTDKTAAVKFYNDAP